MKTLNIFSIVVVLLIAFSCNKATLDPKKSTDSPSSIANRDALLLKYYNFTQQNTDGVVSVSGYSTLPTQNLESREQLSKSFFKAANYSNVALNDVMMTKNTDGNFVNNDAQQNKNLYGKDVNFKFTLPSGDEASKSLYIPNLLYIDVDYDPNTFKLGLQEGTIIRWNKDEKNTNAVVFILDYDPDLSPTTQKTSPIRITKVLGTSDSGNYIMKSSDLTGFPKDGRLIMSVGRAGFNIFQPSNSSSTFSLYGCTLVDVGCIIK